MSSENETLTIESEDSIHITPEGLNPVHLSMRQMMDRVEWDGLSHAQKNTMLRKAFPADYRRTREHWQRKITNARQQGYEVTDDFRVFWAFLYVIGPKPVVGKYQIHREDSDEGYSLGNCVWLDQKSNLEKRGISEAVKEYCQSHGVSRATAYRHFKTEKPAWNPEAESRRTLAEKFHHLWWELFAIHYPKYFPGFSHPQRGKMKRIESFYLEYGHFYSRKRLDFILKYWVTIKGKVSDCYGKKYTQMGDLPELETFMRESGRISGWATALSHELLLKGELTEMEIY